MRRSEHIDRLLAKAAQDEYVLDRLVRDDQAPIEVFGFHAQQAAEKILKALLSAVGVHYPRTHRIAELLDLLRQNGMAVPERFEELRFLTPFAVEFRYDVGPDDDDAGLDKVGIRRAILDLREWVERALTESGGEQRRCNDL